MNDLQIRSSVYDCRRRRFLNNWPLIAILAVGVVVVVIGVMRVWGMG